MRTLTRTAILTPALGLFLLAGEAFSIVVAPTAVFMTDRSPAATLTLFNPGDVPEEVEIEAVFGYPRTNEEGRVHLHLPEEDEDLRSAAGWLRAFPQRVIVAPGERQTVRILASPPPDLADGEYWARLVVTSRGQQVPVTGAPGDDIRVGLSLEVRTVLAATFRKGEVSTGLRVEELEPWVEDETLLFRPRLVREGSAAYVAALTVELVDDQGTVVRDWSERIAVYREYDRLFRYSVDGLPSGTYTVRFALSTDDRDDVPRPFRLGSPDVEELAEVVIP